MTAARSADRRVAVVGGGSRGIGRACVQRLAADGYRVASLARSHRDEAAPHGLDLHADLREAASTAAAVARVRETWGRVDAVVHTAGEMGPPVALAELGWDRWRQTLDACLGTAVVLSEATFASVAEAGGAYVFVSSVASEKVYPGIADYCAAKAALSQLVRCLAAELAPHRARALSISPAVVATDMLAAAPFSEAEAARWHALGRVGRPEEIAAMAAFLLSEEAGWLTGVDLRADGGMMLG